MSIRRIVIVGTGQAGFQAAASLRQGGFDGSLLIIGDEPGLPYQRPPLSKNFLKEGRPERLLFRNTDFFSANAIDLETKTRANSISPRENTVSTDKGKSYQFDHLVLATGTSNKPLPMAGADALNVVGMRTLEDAIRVSERLADVENIVVIGGGFIGLEFAAVARQLGKKLTVVEASDRLMARAVSEDVSQYFLTAHRRNGIDIRLKETVSQIETDARRNATSVLFASGERVPCDLILIAIGVVPNCELADSAMLRTDNGIVVDRTMLTSVPNISAIGDCVSFPHMDRRIRLESVQNAVDQARCVANRLIGDVEMYNKLPWFWSDQGEDKLQIAGLIDVADRRVVRNDNEQRLSVHSFRSGKLCAVETINSAGDHMAARKLLSQPNDVSLQELEDAKFELKGVSKARSQ